MKYIFMLLLLSLTGCIRYGMGSSYGYITTEESGWCSQNLWFRADLSSSNTDCYTLDSSLVDDAMKYAATKQRVTILYERHLFKLCGCSDAKVIGISPITEGK